MKKSSLFLLIGWCLISSGCYRSSGVVWEDAKTMGRHLHRKASLLWRKDIDSRMLESAEDFKAPSEEEYIPYKDDDITSLQTEFIVPAPKHEAGEAGSGIPTIQDFNLPTGNLHSIFQTIHFDTDSERLTLKEREAIAKIASYMKNHPQLYIFVEGHCDERGAKNYNLSLGARRSNRVRATLVQLGVDKDHIFTISFGKELPLDARHTKEAWAKNRRVLFKLFENNQATLRN